MSTYQLSPAIVQRTSDLLVELNNLAEEGMILSYFLAPDAWAKSFLEKVHESQNSFRQFAEEALGLTCGDKDTERQAPYVLAGILQAFALEHANTAAVFMEASNNLPQAQMLAVQYTGVTFASLASTAGYIAETIMEELPRLPSFKAYLPETTQSL